MTANKYHGVLLVLLVSLGALAGCSGTETTPTATPTASGAGTTAAAGGAIHELTISNRTNAPDGAATALTLHVRANTTLWAGDLMSDPEPYFAVELNGQSVLQTPQVEHRDNGTVTIELNASIISSIPAGQTTVTVVLWEADATSDDRIDAASIQVRTAPSVTPEQTATVTATQTPPTATPQTMTTTTRPTGTATPPPTATGTPTVTVSATPTATPTATATTTAPPAPDAPIDGGTARTATVTRVIDGDTVEVRFANGEVDTVRLIGVDTPEPIISNMDPSEYGIPDTPAGRDWLKTWADKASAFADEKLAGEQVLVVTDPESDTRGYYGRLLAYIYVDGENFGKQLLQNGLARVYTGGEFSLEAEYLDIEATAQAAETGLWAFEDETTATPTPEPTPGQTATENVDLPPPSNDGDLPDPYDCGDFDGYPDDVLRTYMQNHPDDPSELDADGDGVACGVEY